MPKKKQDDFKKVQYDKSDLIHVTTTFVVSLTQLTNFIIKKLKKEYDNEKNQN